MKKEVFSLCLMCSVRCPIKVEVENGHVSWIEGNQNMAAHWVWPRFVGAAVFLKPVQQKCFKVYPFVLGKRLCLYVSACETLCFYYAAECLDIEVCYHIFLIVSHYGIKIA